MNISANLSIIAPTVLLGACATGASASSNLVVEEKVTIASKVWAKAGNFGDLGAFHPAVAKTEITSGTSNTKGTLRLLTLGDGGTVNETLSSYAAGMSYAYVINESVLPVSNYSAKIMVKPVSANVSEVMWNANFKRKDLSASPAKGQDD